MKYKVIYEVVKNEQGEIVDLINKAEFFTQSKCAEWLDVNQSTISRAILPNYNKDLANDNIILSKGVAYTIIEC